MNTQRAGEAGAGSAPQRNEPVGGLALVRTVGSYEFTRQMRNRMFWSSLLVTALIAGVGLFVGRLLARDDAAPTVGVAGQQPALTAALQARARVVPYPDAAAARAAVRDERVDAAVLPGGEVVVLRRLDSELARALQDAYGVAAYEQRLRELGATDADLQALRAGPRFRVTALDPEATRVQQRTLVLIGALAVLAMLTVLLGTSIAYGVAEEKASRVVEVLLAKVRPGHLLAGKIAGLGAAVLVQIVVIMTVGLTTAAATGLFTAPADVLGTVATLLLWFLPGFVLFATAYAAAGSLVPRPEDANHVVNPLNVLLLLGLAGSVMVLSGGGRAAEAVSLLPGISWAAMPVRMALAPVPLWQAVLAFALMLLAVVALLRVSSRVYAGGLLHYAGIIKVRDALRNARSRQA